MPWMILVSIVNSGGACPCVLANRVSYFIDYLRQSEPFADKVSVISHNLRRYEAQFLLTRFLQLRLFQQLKIGGSNILSMVVNNLYFLDSLNYLPLSLKGMPKSFNFKWKKGYYHHFFNTANNLDYVGSHSELKFYGQTLCVVMNETYFRPVMRGLKTKFLTVGRIS